MRVAMFGLAAISPGLAIRPVTEVPRPLSPRAGAASTAAILLIGLVLVAGAIRTVLKQ
jgi:hypothetical protein